MLIEGERLWNGKIVTRQLAAVYNSMTAQIERYEREGRQPPQELLNGRHNLIGG